MTRAIRAVIADDEPVARKTIRILLESDPTIEITAEAASGAELIEILEQTRVDLLFLDIELGDLSAFDVLAEVESRSLPLVVFTTAYDEFAIRAFDLHAIDYLLKPFTDDRFGEALVRAKNRLAQEPLDTINERLARVLARDEREKRPRRLLIRKTGRVLFLPVDEVDWFEAADYYVRVHVGKESHLVRKSLSTLERELDPRRFCRVHRSAIVRLDRVREIHELFKGEAIVRLHDGTEIRLSRARRRALERAMAHGQA